MHPLITPETEPVIDIVDPIFQGDERVQAAIGELVAAMRGSPHANNGSGRQFQILFSRAGSEAFESTLQSPSKIRGGSPDDWWRNQDQMTHGRPGKQEKMWRE